MVIDLDHQRLAVVNDHCYTPYTSPSQRKNESRRNTPVQNAKKPDVVKAKPVPSKAQPKKASEDEEEVSDEEGDETDSENTYYSPSENENDRDSDSDFNVSGRPSRVRKFNRSSKNSRNKRIKGGAAKVTKKRTSVGDEDKSDEATTSSAKKKSFKSPKRRSTSTNKTPTTSNVKTSTPISKGASLVKVSVKSDVDVEPKKDASMSSISSGPPLPALAPITNSKPLPQKKDKKQPGHVDAYLNNMSSLFSTPDIIKKVGNEPRSSPNTTSISPAATPPNKTYFMPLNPSSSKNPQQLPAQISVQTHTATPDLEFEQDKQLDLIDSFVRDIVQEELKQSTPTHIPNIVKMLENSDGVLMGEVNNPTQSTASSSFANASTIRETLLDDTDMLGLGHAEDCLPDDLLQHVAKLVEDKKIQEVIDKQVLEEKATKSVPAVMLTPLSMSDIQLAVSKSDKKVDLARSNVSLSTTTTPVQAKEPIKIVRSDGRVILLPPLEAPTTRAKRRALTQSFDSLAKNEPATSTPKNNKPTPKLVEEVRESEKARRSSTTKKPTELPKLKALVPELSTTVAPPDDDDYDDEDSDSNNAEDDPYRCVK